MKKLLTKVVTAVKLLAYMTLAAPGIVLAFAGQGVVWLGEMYLAGLDRDWET